MKTLAAFGKAVAIGLTLLALGFTLSPKVRLNLSSMGITNDNWDHGIAYRSEDGAFVVHCDFMRYDSLPYWEGQNNWDDEHVCGHLPVYLHQGLPQRTFHVEVNGKTIELRAPLFFGWLV